MEQLSFDFEKLDENDFVRFIDESHPYYGLSFWIEKVRFVGGEKFYQILEKWYRKDELKREEIK